MPGSPPGYDNRNGDGDQRSFQYAEGLMGHFIPGVSRKVTADTIAGNKQSHFAPVFGPGDR